MLTLSVPDIHVPEDTPTVVERLRARAEGHILGSRESFIRRMDGVRVPVEVVANTILYGGRLCAAGFFRDITLRKQAQEALAESEETYRNLVEATNTGYVVLDETGRVVDANDEYVRISGHRSLGEIAGRRVTEWTAANDADRNAEEIQICLRAGLVRHLEVDYIGPDGKVIPVEINRQLRRHEAGPAHSFAMPRHLGTTAGAGSASARAADPRTHAPGKRPRAATDRLRHP